MPAADKKSIVLVSMPWASLAEPALGLAHLKASLHEKNVSCRIFHANIFLLNWLRWDSYVQIADYYGLNDFLFTYVFEKEPSEKQFLSLVRHVDSLLQKKPLLTERYTDRSSLIEYFMFIRNEIIPAYLDYCMTEVLAGAEPVIGFTNMYDQTIASLALATRIKEKCPKKLIVFGGKAVNECVGEQILESFDCVDLIVEGEGERTIVQLLQSNLDGDALASIPSLMRRSADGCTVIRSEKAANLVNLDQEPFPIFDDYYFDLNTLKKEHKIEIQHETLMIENSRGCWWGQKNHCVFCGISKGDMAHRAKQGDRVFEHIECLIEKYDVKKIRFADDILPRSYFKTLLPRLAGLKTRCEISCEIKSNISFEEFTLLRKAGFTEVQPGIESFSTPVLKNMAKGVSGIRNVATLKFGKANGVAVHYNILYGFPSDEPEYYDQMVKDMPFIYHLDPPHSFGNVLLCRFAPLQMNPERFGIGEANKASMEFEVVFSETFMEKVRFKMENYCYYFERTYKIPKQLQTKYAIVDHQVEYWQDRHRLGECTLTYELTKHGIRFMDTRYKTEPTVSDLDEDSAKIFLAMSCEIRTIESLAKQFEGLMDGATILSKIDDLVAQRFAYREGTQVLGLALSN